MPRCATVSGHTLGSYPKGVVMAERDMGTEEGRRAAVLETMGSFALEGMQPSAHPVAWVRDYIAGRLTPGRRVNWAGRN